jgi:hypothetical protein
MANRRAKSHVAAEISRVDRLRAVQRPMISCKIEAMARIDGKVTLRQISEELVI